MENQTKKTWNKIAQIYQDKFMSMDIYNSSYDYFISKLKTETAKVLEIGCGPGNISKYLLDNSQSIRLTGLDYAVEMIELAKKNNPTANFAVMDCREIDSIQDTFEGIMIGFCLPYLNPEESNKLVKDCSVLLNKEGVLYISYVAGEESQSGLKTSNTGDSVYFNYHQTEKLQEQLISNGFEITESFEVPYPTADSSEMHQVICAIKK